MWVRISGENNQFACSVSPANLLLAYDRLNESLESTFRIVIAHHNRRRIHFVLFFLQIIFKIILFSNLI